MNTELTNDLRDIISLSFKSNEEEWWIRDLSNSYNFIDNEQLKWIIDGDSNNSLILFKEKGGKWLVLNKWGISLPEINSILLKKQGRITLSKENAENFSKLIMELYEEPRGYVCSPSFLMDQMTVLNTFVINEEFGVEKLKESCVAPIYSTHDGNWNLEFQVLNKQGSVNKWIVSGVSSPLSISNIVKEIIHPDDSFYYPNEF